MLTKMFRGTGIGVCLLATLRTVEAWSVFAPSVCSPTSTLCWLARHPTSLHSPGLSATFVAGRRMSSGAAVASERQSSFQRVYMTASASEEAEKEENTFFLEGLPKAEMECWRPTADDVDRISWGRPAKKKMTGSRGVPHRLNEEERFLYDMAKRKGFLEVAGSGWRKQRRGAPLVNTFRSWCDSRGVPVVSLHKGSGGEDEVVVDLSPMRIPRQFQDVAIKCALAAPGAVVEALEGSEVIGELGSVVPSEVAEEDGDGGDYSLIAGGLMDQELLEAYITEPIYRLPMFCITWACSRSEAKKLCKSLGEAFGVPEPTGKGTPNTLGRGMPDVKPGKNRRHGGFGIGSKGSKPRREPREGKF